MESEDFHPANKKRVSISDISNILIAAVAIVALVFSTCQYRDGIKRESKIDRPIIAVLKSSSSWDSLPNNAFKFVPTSIIQNFGVRPAYDCKFTVTTIKGDNSALGFKLIGVMNLNEANPMVPGIQINLNSTPIIVNDSTEYFFKIKITYKDKISDEYYSDSLYYKWRYINFMYSHERSEMLGLELSDAEIIDNFISLTSSKN